MDIEFAERMHAEWVDQGRRVLDGDTEAGFTAQGYAAGDDGWHPFHPMYHVNAGRRPDREGYWRPDRRMLLRLLARTYEIRSRRLDPFSGEILPHSDVWHSDLIDRWPAPWLRSYPLVGPGWADLLESMCVELATLDAGVVIEDVKEKFGRCRLNLSLDGGAYTDIDEHVELLSGYICEECGAPGKPRNTGWIKTLCDDHVRRTK